MNEILISKLAHVDAVALFEIHALLVQANQDARFVNPMDILTIINTKNQKRISLCDAAAAEREQENPPMLAILRDRNGEEYGRLTLTDTEPLDCDYFAGRFSAAMGFELEGETDGTIPDGCEDYSVTLTQYPDSVSVWKSANYMVKQE